LSQGIVGVGEIGGPLLNALFQYGMRLP
jgi:hypothetical protein